MINSFLPTVPTFAVRETDVSRQNGGTSGALLKPLRDDSALIVSRTAIRLIAVVLSDRPEAECHEEAQTSCGYHTSQGSVP